MSDKPKRISFWESENEVIRQWCKDQTNLGTSLDLIIADAIKVYGKGDVIKAYLNQRMMDMQSQGAENHIPSHHERSAAGAAPISSSPSWQSKSVTHQVSSDNASIGNTIRQEASSGLREDPSIMDSIGDSIRREATAETRGNEPFDMDAISNSIRREATGETTEQEDSSDMEAISDSIRREATSSSPQSNTSDGNRSGSNSPNDNLSIFLGDSGTHLT